MIYTLDTTTTTAALDCEHNVKVLHPVLTLEKSGTVLFEQKSLKTSESPRPSRIGSNLHKVWVLRSYNERVLRSSRKVFGTQQKYVSMLKHVILVIVQLCPYVQKNKNRVLLQCMFRWSEQYQQTRSILELSA